MKKKTAAMVLAALMAFSMTACGNDSTQKEDDSTAADQETTEATETADNTVADDTASGDEAVELHWLNKCESDVEAQIWQQVADLVHEKYPNITVTVENTDWTSYWTKLPVELASGNAPDLIYMHFSRASDYTNSMLPISDYIEKDEDINIDDFYSGILDSFIFEIRFMHFHMTSVHILCTTIKICLINMELNIRMKIQPGKNLKINVNS